MKNRLFLIIATAACLGSITSCSQDDGTVVPDGDLKAAISFNVNIGQTTAPQADMRGASKDDTADGGYIFQGDELISIAIKGKSGSARSTVTEEIKQYTVADGNGGVTNGSKRSLTYPGAATDAFIWMGTGETITLRAWADGTTSTAATDPDGQTFTIEATQTGDYVKELLYSPADDYDYNISGINIPLYHQLARVVVNVGATIDDSFSVNSVTIGYIDTDDPTNNKLIPTSAIFGKPSSGYYGTWTLDGSETKGVITAKKETETGKVYSAVVIPCNGNDASSTYYKKGHKFITIDTSRGTYVYAIGTTGENQGLNIEPGKQYTFNITDLNQINLNVTVSAWVDDDNTALQF